eukprot:jgi/Mesvir1/6070/Mv00798-RA.1
MNLCSRDTRGLPDRTLARMVTSEGERGGSGTADPPPSAEPSPALAQAARAFNHASFSGLGFSGASKALSSDATTGVAHGSPQPGLPTPAERLNHVLALTEERQRARENGHLPGTPWVPAVRYKLLPDGTLFAYEKGRTYAKFAQNIMREVKLSRQRAVQLERKYPPFRAGDVLELSLVAPELDRKPYTWKALCIARQGGDEYGGSFRVRSVLGDISVERVFPLYCPHLLGIKVLERRKVRRAKLFYLRDKPLRESRV